MMHLSLKVTIKTYSRVCETSFNSLKFSVIKAIYVYNASDRIFPSKINGIMLSTYFVVEEYLNHHLILD